MDSEGATGGYMRVNTTVRVHLTKEIFARGLD